MLQYPQLFEFSELFENPFQAAKQILTVVIFCSQSQRKACKDTRYSSGGSAYLSRDPLVREITQNLAKIEG